ncbi:hypothetical protein [Haloglomus halophilum]|uniref:hypothetical protein n=1 Tax=Haloglomus halophilum TaxID=2962672 RepID=UPI0020C95C40|nr:hypothetical protein [Haloglomus halophilum]
MSTEPDAGPSDAIDDTERLAVPPARETEAGFDVGRRDILKAAGLAAGATLLSGQATAKPGNGNGGSDSLEYEGRHVVGPNGYATIQAAWDAASSGDTVYVHSSYDAEAAGESFPIVLDHREKEVLLTGGHASGSVIDASHVPSKNVLEVIGAGHTDYRNTPAVQNLKLVGGNVGLRIRGSPYAGFSDLVVWKASSHGVQVDRFEVDGTTYGTFGTTFRDCMAWNCGGDGFRMETGADPHSTSFYGCEALLNGGAGVRLRGYATRWHGGTIQNNASFGVDVRSGCSQQVSGTYFEGNGTADSAPIEVYVDDSAAGFALHDAYFQGGFFRDFSNSRDTGRWGVVVADAPHVDIRNCSFRNYTDSFLYLRGATDADVHLASHCPLDGTTPIVHDSCTRLRSGGAVLPTDLSTQPGRFVGDTGAHDGAGDAPWGPAMWNGTNWVSVLDGTQITNNV